jgi:hypothetical protein
MSKAKKGKETGIIGLLIRIFKPDYHLAKNPPKGKKRVKKVQSEITTGISHKQPDWGG